MKHLFFLKILLILIGTFRLFLGFIESFYVFIFNKPLFVHFYLVKKKLPRKEKEFLEKNIRFYQSLDAKYQRYFEHRLAKFIRKYEFIGKDGFTITPE